MSALPWIINPATGHATLALGNHVRLLAFADRYDVRIGLHQISHPADGVEHAKMRAIEVAREELKPVFDALMARA